MQRPRRAAVLALTATAALAIAGCGGGDDTTDPTTAATGASGVAGAPLTEAEFVSRGNAICEDVNAQLATLEQPTNDMASIAEFAEQGLAITEPALAEFRALTPPADLQATFDEYLAQAEEQLEKTRELQAAAEAGDAQQVKALLAEIRALETEPLAVELGLDVCAPDA